MTKYREYFERMITNEKEKFDKFTKLHMQFSLDQDGLQEKFNTEGTEIVTIIREWESKLCSTSEKAGYGGYTSNLSEKFWQEVRKSFPLIDYVGVIVKSNAKIIKKNQKVTEVVAPAFEIKKIKL
jgi:rubrerythrin